MREDAFIHDISFEYLNSFEQYPSEDTMAGKRAVVVGGGTGAPASIKALLGLGAQVAAVVAMADDGKSTGALRREADVTPPGDIRKCLAAMADPVNPLLEPFTTRFEFAERHALGNLMLSALEESCGSFEEAIDQCADMLGARGDVIPSTLQKVVLYGRTKEEENIAGQSAISRTLGLEQVWLQSEDGLKIEANERAVEALKEADIIVLGPGSLFTSILPNLLIEGISDAIRESSARIWAVCSLADLQGETRGMSVWDQYSIMNGFLSEDGSISPIEYLFVHDPSFVAPDIPRVQMSDDDRASIEAKGTHVYVANFANEKRQSWHDVLALRKAFAEVL